MIQQWMCVYCWLLRKPLQYQHGMCPRSLCQHRELCNISWAEGIHLVWTVSNNFFTWSCFHSHTKIHGTLRMHTLHLSHNAARHCCIRDGLQGFSGQAKTVPTCTFIFYCRRPLHITRSASDRHCFALISHSWQGQQLICLQSAGTVESKISHDNCLHHMASNVCD